MGLRPLASRLLVAYARPSAFVDKTQAILARLGYRIVAPETVETLVAAGRVASPRPDLLIVDEGRLGDLPDGPGLAHVPIILLCGRRGRDGHSDGRIAGALRRPAGLHELYRLVQEILEETPRTLPRAPTRLEASCRREGRVWRGSVLSLSENGCLLRSEERLPLGSRFDLDFELPRARRVELQAEAAYELSPDLGVVFSGIAPATRIAIGDYVSEALLARPRDPWQQPG